jgi:hypothetical protein
VNEKLPGGELFAENASLQSYEPYLRQDPIPTLADLQLGSAPLKLSVPLEQISITIPYAVALFNKKYYWETHEVLEDLWMDDYGPHRAFLQGFIQGSAALYHVVGQNPSGYERLSRLSREKLANYRGPQLGVDLGNCLNAFALYDANIQRGEKFDHHHLPKITFAGIAL